MGNTTNLHSEPVLPNDTHTMVTFMGVLAHEIRSQMAAIYTTSDVMKDNKNMGEDGLECLSIISSASYNALHVLDNMMATAKLSKGKLEFKPLYSRLHFRDWLKLLIQRFNLMISMACVEIHVNIGNKVPEYITTDSVKLEQILYNLVSNAIKSTLPHTSIELNVGLQGDRQLSFQIIDHGKGIREDKLPLLFQPFQQLEKGRAGTGLGLYICKLYVAVLGGEITVYSRNDGTTFIFFITLQTDIDAPYAK